METIKSNIERAVKYQNEIKSRCSMFYEIPETKIHVGHAISQVARENSEELAQIDGATGERRTWGDIFKRVNALSQALTNYGLKTGDILYVLIPNHSDACIPIYAGLVNGYPVLPVDVSGVQSELEIYAKLSQAKVAFVIPQRADHLKAAFEKHGIDTTIIVLGDPERGIDAFIAKHGQADVTFKPPQFDLNTKAWLIRTSGTTGVPKLSIISHKNIFDAMPMHYYIFDNFHKPIRSTFLLPVPQWISGLIIYALSAITAMPRIQSPLFPSAEHCIDVIEKYNPACFMTSAPKLTELFYGGCDMSRIEFILTGGCPMNVQAEKEFRERYPKTKLLPIFGLTETVGACLAMDFTGNAPLRSVGLEYPTRFMYKIVDPETQEVITEPNVVGELWLKDDSPMQGYLNSPEETALLYSPDNYMKTGDLIYKDADGYIFFVERLKLLIKYRSIQMYPKDIEDVVIQHPAVAQVVVTSVPDQTCGDMPTAVIVLKKDKTATAKEIYDFVHERVPDPRNLRGGIAFVDSLPYTPAFKIDIRKVKEIALNGKREL